MNVHVQAALAGLAAPLVCALGALAAAHVGDGALRTVVQIAIPVLVVLPFYPQFVARVREGDLRRAVLASLAWAASASAGTIAVLMAMDADHAAADALLWNARTYREDMVVWIRTGVGQEGDPSIYLSQHAGHFLAFVLLTLVSRGFLGLVLGAALLNYMNAYVAALLLHAESPWLLAPLSWPAYALVRVVGFVCVATAITALWLGRRGQTRATVGSVRTTLWVGFGLVLADLALKAVLAPLYRSAFVRFTDWAG